MRRQEGTFLVALGGGLRQDEGATGISASSTSNQDDPKHSPKTGLPPPCHTDLASCSNEHIKLGGGGALGGGLWQDGDAAGVSASGTSNHDDPIIIPLLDWSVLEEDDATRESDNEASGHDDPQFGPIFDQNVRPDTGEGVDAENLKEVSLAVEKKRLAHAKDFRCGVASAGPKS